MREWMDGWMDSKAGHKPRAVWLLEMLPKFPKLSTYMRVHRPHSCNRSVMLSTFPRALGYVSSSGGDGGTALTILFQLSATSPQRCQ